VVEPKNESNEQYFKRRGEERQEAAQKTERLVQQSEARREGQLDELIRQYDSDVRALLESFAQQAPEIVDHQVRGPEKLKTQVEWSIDYTRAVGLAKRSILVSLRYVRAQAGEGQCVPDYFSVSGLIGHTTVKPPTIEGLRKTLSDATFRS